MTNAEPVSQKAGGYMVSLGKPRGDAQPESDVKLETT
jgi:hypothetical protein